MLFILKTHLCPLVLYLQSMHSFTSTSAEDTADESSDLTELDTEGVEINRVRIEILN